MISPLEVPELAARPVVNLNLKVPLAIHDLANKFQVTELYLLDQVRLTLERFYRQFGIRPFNLEYLSGQGYVIRANSNVGRLESESVIFEISPKIPGLSLNKVLSMAQCIENNTFKLYDSKIRSRVHLDLEYELIDILAFSLLDSVEEVIRNGLHRDFVVFQEATFRSSGAIAFSENINRGFAPPPVVEGVETTIDTLPNRIIKLALTFLENNIKNVDLRDEVRNALIFFDEVSYVPDLLSEVKSADNIFSLPRSDYERCLNLAVSILSGANFSLSDAGNGYTPSCLVDLDAVFEAFCSTLLEEIFSKQYYAVEIQSVQRHDTEPPINNTLVPDLIIRNRRSGKVLILDLKNKYSQSGESQGGLSTSNSDIFQIFYYGQTLGAEAVMLLYPSARPQWRFPLRGSEGAAKYQAKVSAALTGSDVPKTRLMANRGGLDLYRIQVDLSKDMKNTRESLASVASFVDHLLS